MFKDPYCTVEEADLINTSSTWIGLSDPEKDTALIWGRIYLDSKYKCSTNLPADEVANATEARKVANALLGEQYALGNMFKTSPTNDATVTEKSVKAGSVSISKKYSQASNVQEIIDPFPQVTAVLAGYCSFTSAGLRNVNVIRM